MSVSNAVQSKNEVAFPFQVSSCCILASQCQATGIYPAELCLFMPENVDREHFD